MGKRLVKKSAPAVVETEDVEYPKTSPNGADFVFTDDNGVAHYKDGATWVPKDEEDSTPEEEEEAPEDSGEADDEEDAKEEEETPAPAAETPAPEVEKRAGDGDLAAFDALGLSSALVENIREIFTNTDVSKREETFENVMLRFNQVMDTAAGQWLTGSSVSKREDDENLSAAVEAITKTYTSVVESVGGTPVSKKDETVDIYKGLTPQAAEIVRKAAENLENAEVAKYESVAKSFDNVPGDKVQLGKALRTLAETNPEQYEVVKAALAAADEGMADSAIFKSFGLPGEDTATDPVSKAVSELISKGDAKTREEAELKLMEMPEYGHLFYKATNA